MQKGHNFGICKICGKDHGLNPMLGKHHSEETKKKLRDTHSTPDAISEQRKRTTENWRNGVFDEHSKKIKEDWEKGVYDEIGDKISVKTKARWDRGEMSEIPKKTREQWASGRMSEVNLGGGGVSGKRADLSNQFFRSTWEANVARIMNYWGIKWEYEVKRIPYNNGTKTHMIDFYLPETDSYLEVYAYLDKRHLEEFYGVYESGLSTQLIGPDVYSDLEKEFKDKLPFWENGRKKAKTLNT